MTDTNKTKSAIREARRSLKTFGPCYVDQKYIEPGYHYRWAIDEPGRIPSLERVGYTVVHDENIKPGDRVPANSSALGTAVTIMYKSTIPLVLMRIQDEFYQEIENVKKEEMEATMESLGHINGVDEEHLLGAFKIGKK